MSYIQFCNWSAPYSNLKVSQEPKTDTTHVHVVAAHPGKSVKGAPTRLALLAILSNLFISYTSMRGGVNSAVRTTKIIFWRTHIYHVVEDEICKPQDFVIALLSFLC